MDKNLEKIEEILSKTIREQKTEEITPSESIKNRLDEALKAKKFKPSFFMRQIPVYQAAVAIAVLVIVIGISFLRPESPPEIIHNTTEIIKYVDRPVTQIEYIKVPVIQYVTKEKEENEEEQIAVIEDTDAYQGISIANDTMLQKMLVTIY